MGRLYTLSPDEQIEAISVYLFSKYPEIKDDSTMQMSINTKTKLMTCNITEPEAA